MPTFSLLFRHLPRRLPIATLGSSGSKLFPEPDGFIERGILARPPLGMRHIFARIRKTHTGKDGINKEDSPLEKAEKAEKVHRKIYKNKHGEEIMFIPINPPRGYVFVPAGNAFLTRRCRELGTKVYAVYRPKSRNNVATQKGLYVMEDTFMEAEFDYMAKRTGLEEKLWRALEEKYPKIPVVDKDKLHCLILSIYPRLDGKPALAHIESIAYRYVRDRYTPFESIPFHEASKHVEAIDRVHQRASEILDSWRNEDKIEKSSKKK